MNNKVREALEFYADPFAWKKKHDPGNDIQVPDFYSETAFGDIAVEALASLPKPLSEGEAIAVFREAFMAVVQSRHFIDQPEAVGTANLAGIRAILTRLGQQGWQPAVIDHVGIAEAIARDTSCAQGEFHQRCLAIIPYLVRLAPATTKDTA